MSIAWPQSIVEGLARRRVVILIGSGVSANATSAAGTQPPTWGEFLRSTYKDLHRGIPHIERGLEQYNYLEVCDYLKTECGAQWQNIIRSTFVSPRFKAAEIHNNIFNLDCRIIVSLNFDDIYEKYARKLSDDSILVKNYYDDDIRQTVTGSERYVLKPHGSVDTIPRMIFTLEDYAKARVQHASFYELMTALLHTHTFLCIGCGLADPDIKLIFEDYRYKFNETPHFITLAAPVSDAECALIEKTRGMSVLKYSKAGSHKELTASLQELAILVSSMREEISISQNW
jgi:SIR2-like domain